jgi:7-keto-8-aminopelargonate synthetase-like enzyme
MTTLQQKPGRTTTINGKEYLFFSGYSYLGLSGCEAFIELVKKGIDQYGIVYPSSRISNTPLDLYSELESKLATLTLTEAATIFSSGFLSARTAVEVVGREMNVYCFTPTHPASSAYSSAKQIPVNQTWNDFLTERASANEYNFGLACDSINPTPGIIRDFRFLSSLPSQFHITLIIDDSHGIGWMGQQGEGIISALRLPANIDLLLNFSMSKAFHINAGAICGSTKWVQQAKQHIHYTTSTPPMPALAYAFLKSDKIFSEQRTRLKKNMEYLQKLTATFTFVANEETPVFLLNKADAANSLLNNNIIISSFGYPHPEDEAVNRIVVNALHLKSDLEKLARLTGQL